MVLRLLKKYYFFILFVFIFYLFQNLYVYAENDISFFIKINNDYINFYSKDNILPFSSAFLIGGVFANTNIDENIKNKFQENLRNKQTDEVSKYVKILGDGKYIFPIVILASSLSYMDEELVVSKWGGVTFRTYITGLLPMVLMQRVTGASRPDEDRDKISHWKFWSDENGVSGHAFVGAVPFLTMAKMADNNAAKAVFYLASTATAWSRINDNAHYFSQTMLGWYMAYKSVDAVFKTDDEKDGQITFCPIVGDEFYGISCSFHF